jgi:aspartyl-tRNA(Asn)/glutamyl-tRNA(Gln) amidotransferase subunit C
MSTQLTREEVEKVANLSRLKLSDQELEALGTQMGSVLKYIAMLDELDTSSVEPMAHAIEISNVFREDKLLDSLPREQALSNAPQTDGKYFLVPAIL